MRKRAELMDETRLRITEAAMKLHTTVGPANTTISGVAEEADVTRATVYRHFPDEEALFLACSSHWFALHPGPDIEDWAGREDHDDRVRAAFTDLYSFYRDNQKDLHPIMRDFEAMPEGFQRSMMSDQAAMVDVLMRGSGARRGRRERLRATLILLVSFWSWRALEIEAGLTPDAGVDLAAGLVLAVRDAG